LLLESLVLATDELALAAVRASFSFFEGFSEFLGGELNNRFKLGFNVVCDCFPLFFNPFLEEFLVGLSAV